MSKAEDEWVWDNLMSSPKRKPVLAQSKVIARELRDMIVQDWLKKNIMISSPYNPVQPFSITNDCVQVSL